MNQIPIPSPSTPYGRRGVGIIAVALLGGSGSGFSRMVETRPGEGTRGSQGGRRLNTYDAGSDRHVLPCVLGGDLMEFQWLGGLCGGTELTGYFL